MFITDIESLTVSEELLLYMAILLTFIFIFNILNRGVK